MAQKKNGKADINDASLQHFPSSGQILPSTIHKRSASPSKGSNSSGGKSHGKGKTLATSARNSDEEEEEDSGDEAEKLDEEQMNEIDTIYRK